MFVWLLREGGGRDQGNHFSRSQDGVAPWTIVLVLVVVLVLEKVFPQRYE
jgi:hypothetical protein